VIETRTNLFVWQYVRSYTSGADRRHTSYKSNASHEPTRPPGATLDSRLHRSGMSTTKHQPPRRIRPSIFFPGNADRLGSRIRFPKSPDAVESFRSDRPFCGPRLFGKWNNRHWGMHCPKMTPDRLKAKTSPTRSMPHNLASSKHFCASLTN
jgi:hypothetical protein